jgi:hypothetical protein
MPIDMFPFIVSDTEAVRFWVDVDGRPVSACVTRECLVKLGCTTDYVDRAISAYFRNKRAIDGIARSKHLAGEEPVVMAADF